jgi:hypothetical protein
MVGPTRLRDHVGRLREKPDESFPEGSVYRQAADRAEVDGGAELRRVAAEEAKKRGENRGRGNSGSGSGDS